MLRKYPPQFTISESSHNKLADLCYTLGMLPNPPKKFSELPNYESIPKVA
jgi:hypothetical protein